MSTPKIIRVYSPNSKSQNNHQTTCSDVPRDRSSLDTLISSQKTSQMENYYSLLIDQVKKLSRDNDRMWKLLTQTQEQHSSCDKAQSKLQQSLECAEKELSMMKDIYDTEKTNFHQSKIFFEKRQHEWQQIVGELKKVIENYESTNNLDMDRASQIFNQTSDLKLQTKIDQLPNFDKQLSIYSKRIMPLSQQSEIDQQFESVYHNNFNKTNNSAEEEQYSDNGSMMSHSSKSHRSKLIRSKNFINKGNGASLSAKKICEKLYAQQMTKLEYYPCNPEDAMELLTMEEIFERSLRKTYIKYRTCDQKAYQILDSPHMDKLKTAKSSTKQRLSKTIRKVFVFDSQQQLDDVIKYIEDKVYKKYHLMKGDLIFKFLQDKFKECEQIFESTNSSLDRLDREPSNFINGALMNSKFKQFQQKRKDERGFSNSLRATQMIAVTSSRQSDMKSHLSPYSSQLGLSINSNIKDNTVLHSNNHMKTSLQKEVKKTQRDQSQKNIYTEKRISRRGLVEQLSHSHKSIQSSQMTKNLSSLIGASQQYEINTIKCSTKTETSQRRICK